MLDFLNSTLEIASSLIAIIAAIIGGSIAYIRKHNSGRVSNSSGSSNNTTIIGDGNIVNPIINNVKGNRSESTTLKDSVQILFIDDEDFNVVKMLKKAGWKNIKKKGDFSNLDDLDLRNADVVFVDIKGVGIVGGYKNEGIGLAAAIKAKYPTKGVVIYSGTHAHDIFDEDIDSVDARLPKNAEPIQFSGLIEQYGKKN